ncbi:hypothetical protein IQ235_16150, partial [Oscillatoriales cyanobacterium LEGE 11467]
YGTIVSGCPLFPSELFCLDLPWRVTEQRSKGTAEEVRFWWKYAEDNSSWLPDFLVTFWAWFVESKKSQLMIILFALSVPMTWRILSVSERHRRWEYTCAIALGFAGMIFILTQSPLIRFGLGYFILIPSLWSARCVLPQIQTSPQTSRGFFSRHLLKLGQYLTATQTMVLLPTLFAVAAIALCDPRHLGDRLFLPPHLPRVELERDTNNGIEYVRPVDSIQCWASELPCTHYALNSDIVLREPASGIGVGFKLTD